MRRILISCAVVAVALLAQLTIINRLALPGGAGPDLVLLAVVALSLTGGPLPGMLTGFLAGLALDVAPPASHTIGQYTLVFCLVGYGCGLLAGLGDASPALYVAISAAAAAVGAALHAVLGVMLSDPEVTWAAVRHVLPPTLIYNVILSPFVLYAVVRLNGWAGRSAGEESAAAATGSAAQPSAGAVRQASGSGTPKLHLGGRRGGGSAGRPGPARGFGGRPELKLNFSGAGSVASRGAARFTPPKTPKMRFGTGGRRDSLAGRGTAPLVRAATPRFRRRGMTGTLGTGGALNRATPRRGTFGGKKTFAGQKNKTFGGRTRLGRRSAPRLRMRRGTARASLRRLLPRKTGRGGMGGYR